MAVKGGTSVTHSFSRPPAASQSVDSRPTKCSICCKSEKGAGLFQAQALFKGGLIFDVDMYLDFTASTEKGRNQLHLHVAFGHDTHFVLGSWRDKVCLLSGPNGTFVLTHAAPPCNTGGFREALHV